MVCYALFPLFPSEPPRTVFPGQDFPSWNTVFRRFNWWLLGGYGIHTSVFPSAHVTAAFSAALAVRKVLADWRWVGRTVMTLAALIATATVAAATTTFVDALAVLASPPASAGATSFGAR
jgi:membrane-associated phospholipid phosphatase